MLKTYLLTLTITMQRLAMKNHLNKYLFEEMGTN